MSDASGSRQTVSVRCEKHGLRYNPNLHSGCVRCRKEAGEAIGAPTASAPTGSVPTASAPTASAPAVAPATPAAAADQSSMMPALGVTLFLVLATGAGFYFVHEQIHENPGQFLIQDEDGLTPEERERLEEMWRTHGAPQGTSPGGQ